jgi:hypothetical protein
MRVTMGRQASHAAQVGAVARTTFVLLVLVSSLGAACATTRTTAGKSPNVPRPFPGAPLPPIPDTPVPDAAAVPPALVETLPAVVTTALTLRGMPYRNGGSQPADGFDCSGLVQWVFAQHGTPLPRDVRQQFDVGEKIGPNQLLPGDLVFFQTVSRGPLTLALRSAATSSSTHRVPAASSGSSVCRIPTGRSGGLAPGGLLRRLRLRPTNEIAASVTRRGMRLCEPDGATY